MNEVTDVIVIEDNDDLRRVVADEFALPSRKITVRPAESMLRAMSLIMERRPDVVVLDLGLAETSGVQSVQVLHRFCKEMAIVVFTGRDDDSLALECMRAGANDYIVKVGRPTFMDDLAARVRLAKHCGARLGGETDLHDKVQEKLDSLLARLPKRSI